MANITRFDPFSDLLTLRDSMDRMFDERFLRPLTWRGVDGESISPAIDVHQDADWIVVEAALPGVKPEDVDISITGQTLTIRGEAKADERIERDQYLYRERRYGAFHRQLQLPVRVEGERAEADFEDGVLNLRIPKADEVKPRRIEVKAAPRMVGGNTNGKDA
ncbi:MAG TPA: Hsp20/alpha crystallin family protein [Candidatus Limnocylindria bacterium]|nr:Hsp20/alpha crystallin family protein [Candidatus Limnocylindria bacterium]